MHDLTTISDATKWLTDLCPGILGLLCSFSTQFREAKWVIVSIPYLSSKDHRSACSLIRIYKLILHELEMQTVLSVWYHLPNLVCGSHDVARYSFIPRGPFVNSDAVMQHFIPDTSFWTFQKAALFLWHTMILWCISHTAQVVLQLTYYCPSWDNFLMTVEIHSNLYFADIYQNLHSGQ